MIAMASLLLNPAIEAKMAVPTIIANDDVESIDKDKYPHFYVFCCLQLGLRMPSPSSHWENAKIIAAIPEDKIRYVTAEDINKLGFQGYV